MFIKKRRGEKMISKKKENKISKKFESSWLYKKNKKRF